MHIGREISGDAIQCNNWTAEEVLEEGFGLIVRTLPEAEVKCYGNW